MAPYFDGIDLTASIARIGPIFQVAWVPQNFEAALDYWLRVMGVGPFFIMEHIPMRDTEYYGQQTPVDMTVANSFWGNVQIELVRQHNADTTIYTTWRDSGQRGPHHMAIAAPDLAAAQARIEGAGGVIAQRGVVPGACEYWYYDLGGTGPYIEIGRANATFRNIHDQMKAAAGQWDGRDPVRYISASEYAVER
jgi:glyoxalase/bleomycin resistance protein/dioxygenase superfamily protein